MASEMIICYEGKYFCYFRNMFELNILPPDKVDYRASFIKNVCVCSFHWDNRNQSRLLIIS